MDWLIEATIIVGAAFFALLGILVKRFTYRGAEPREPEPPRELDVPVERPKIYTTPEDRYDIPDPPPLDTDPADLREWLDDRARRLAEREDE